MTNKHEWRMAKWIKRHGETKICNLPPWFGTDYQSRHNFFSIMFDGFDKEGWPIFSDQSSLFMSDENLDAYRDYRRRKIHEFRDWLEPAGVVIANIIAIIALIVSIIGLSN